MSTPYRLSSGTTLDLPATRLVPPPRNARRVARLLLVAFFTVIVSLVFVPWIQNVQGSGRVVAYLPIERQQLVEAPVSGRVVTWWVREGSRVEEGDRLVEIIDNDPELLGRLEAERAAVEAQLAAYVSRAAELELRAASYERVRATAITSAEAKVRVARDKVDAAEQKLQAAEATLQTASLNLTRQLELYDEGLASQREKELAELAVAKARTGRDEAQASLSAARNELTQSQADLEKTRADTAADLESARASFRSAESDAANSRAKLAQIDVKVSRQRAQLVTAPRAGTVLRLVANQGGEQVKQGDPLLVLVPETNQRAVEMWVDGNDAALITPGRHVRLQFEGWPAVQFSGWPSAAVGTFGGRVAFVDAADDGQGDFRIVVLPDEEDEPWPTGRYLRQGVRANGWVLLDQVSLGFELWRQLNGFPPAISPPPPAPGAQGDIYGGKGPRDPVSGGKKK